MVFRVEGRREIPFTLLISAYASNLIPLPNLKPCGKYVWVIGGWWWERVLLPRPKGYGLSRVVGGPFLSLRVVYISNLTEPKTLRKIPRCV